jgi:hypothetical protein
MAAGLGLFADLEAYPQNVNRNSKPRNSPVDPGSAMRHAQVMARRSPAEIPVDLRARLEKARLDLLTLFRALDRMELSPAEIPNA